MKLKKWLALSCVFIAQASFSAPNDWIDFGGIIGITEDPGGLYLYTEKVGSGTAGIEACGGNRVFISSSDAERLRSLVYMAYAKDDKIYVYSQQCKTQWGQSFTKVMSLYVK